VSSQYGDVATNGVALARGDFAEIFDSGRDADNTDLRQYCIQTMIEGYNLPPGSPPSADRKLAILGRLEWGIGGVGMACDFDWKMGNQLSVAASFIRLSAAYSETVLGPPNVKLTAMFSSGGRAARSQVTRSYPLLTFSDTQPVLFPVPPMAHALNLFSPSASFYTAAAVSVRFVGGASAGLSAVSTDLCALATDGVPFKQALATEDGVRFPETTRFVEIIKLGAAGTLFVVPSFTLNL
jgi:hypothetical protein